LDAFRYLAREHVLVNQLAGDFRARPEELPERISGVLDRLKDAERELGKLRVGAVLASAGSLAAAAESVNGVQLVAAEAPAGVSGNDLRTLAMDVRGRLGGGPAVVLLASPTDNGGVAFVAAVNQAGQDAGVSAGSLVKDVFTPAIGAKGGGKGDLAQGAGGDASQLGAAFAAVRAALDAR
jgi:alanyl-tRNA synthetase